MSMGSLRPRSTPIPPPPAPIYGAPTATVAPLQPRLPKGTRAVAAGDLTRSPHPPPVEGGA